MGSAIARPIIFGLFFLSGFAALIYQVVWQRVLALFSGADVYSVSIIVAAFMAGLGLGSWAGGALADRLSLRARILAFAAAELAIAAFAVVSLWLYYDVLYVRWAELGGSPILLALILFGALVIPTFLMGASLPLLAAAATRNLEEAASVVGRLYAVNTIGAAVGAFIATWILTRLLGFETAVQVAAMLNTVSGVAALAVGPLLAMDPPAAPSSSAAGRDPAPPAAPAFRPEWWFVLYGLSGFIALSLEVLWFRVLGVILKSNAFTFGTLLTVYLAGLAAGAWLGQVWARRTRDPVRDFLALQASVTLYAAVALLLFWQLIDHLPPAAPLWAYMNNYEGLDIATALAWGADFVRGDHQAWRLKPLAEFLVLYGALPLWVVGPPTLFMGASFTLLHRAAQTDLSRVGRRVGGLQGWNIAGSMLGALATGLVMLRFLGTPGTLRVLIVLGGVFLALLFIRQTRRPAIGLVAAAVGLLLLCAAIPAGSGFWAKLHGVAPGEAIAAEDGSGVAVLKPLSSVRRETGITVFLGGLGQSHIPFTMSHVKLGMAPTMLHPNPRDVALIGLGSGATLYGASGRQETERVVSVEIVEPLYHALKDLAAVDDDPALHRVLDDRRVQHVFGDGRAYLARSGQRFDVIEADALRPTSAYAGNLYSREYFELLRAHLKPGGLAVTWAPTQRVKDTFISVFPYVLFYNPNVELLIGSDRPIVWDAAAMGARLQTPFSQAHYRAMGPKLAPELASMLQTVRPTAYGPQVDRSGLTDLNSDLFPRDELLTPR